ncbi:MAG TPA: TetR/AcrR family transcriptional regulator [Chloroflexia bacterium]|nr:TetR/AcrR family transcriptional regulator [Chloroflexia bacterium]
MEHCHSLSRRERERQELRRAILDTAREIASSEGWEAVTIRRISGAIEYGAPAIYALFENKEAILNELVRDGFQRLLEALREAEQYEMEPEARLLALGRAYWEFAERCPRIYKAMHGLDGVPFGDGYKPDEIYELKGLMAKSLKQIFPEKHLTPQELDDMVQLMRATLIGLVSVTMANRLEGGRERAQALLERALKDYLTAWRVM